MATIRPFPALLPKPELASQLCEPPYDVLSTEEARSLAEGNPWSFLRVSKPEIGLPPGTHPYNPEVYELGRQNFRRLIDQGALSQDGASCLYLYRQVMGAHTQVGIVAAASCQEYLDNVIRKHELTRVDKEDDRVRHIEALEAQTGPVFLTYRSEPEIDGYVARQVEREPLVDFTAPDAVRHTSWRISDPAEVQWLSDAFSRIPRLYIADGHHRSAAAGRVFQARQGGGASGGFLTVIFPHNQMQILPYHRVLTDLNGHSANDLFRRLNEVFVVTPDAAAQPARQHEVGLFLEGRWYQLTFRPSYTATADAIEGLDVTLLQRHVLGPVFGIDNPRTSERIRFVGGIRGTGELETLVQRGEAACAFSLFPTRIEDLLAIADAGGIMPPKSTWFEPKLRDAMFCLLL